MDKTFTVSKDERTHDESGRGLEMGFYFVCYGRGIIQVVDTSDLLVER